MQLTSTDSGDRRHEGGLFSWKNTHCGPAKPASDLGHPEGSPAHSSLGINPEAVPCTWLTGTDRGHGHRDLEAQKGFALAVEHALMVCDICHCPRPSGRLPGPWQLRTLTQRQLPAHGSTAQTEEKGGETRKDEGAFSLRHTHTLLACDTRQCPRPIRGP